MQTPPAMTPTATSSSAAPGGSRQCIDAGEGAAPLRLRAEWDGSEVVAARVEARPEAIGPRLCGLSSAEAAARLVDIAGDSPHAHATALRLACAAAAGEPPPAHDERLATERELAAELVAEHLGRLLLDWPPVFGEDARPQRNAEFHHRLLRPGQTQEALYALGGEILDLVARELLTGFFRRIRPPHTLAEFIACAEEGGILGSVLAALLALGKAHPPVGGALPMLEPAAVAEWTRSGSAPLPHAAETGALARHRHSPLIRILHVKGHLISARLMASMLDVADGATRMRHPLFDALPALAQAGSPASGVGRASVDSAHGILLYSVTLRDGLIAACDVIRPEDWNFADDGPFLREAHVWPASARETALQRLHALTLALAPGVPYLVELVGR